MEYRKDRAWLEIDLSAIEENYRRIKEFIGDQTEIMAVVKANAYGLGAVEVSKTLENAGCPMFAAACIEEAMELRENGIKAPILTLGPVMPYNAKTAAENGIEVPLMSLEQAKEMSEAAQKAGVTVKAHIKADAGLSRFGIVLEGRIKEAADEAEAVTKLPNIECVGVFTHYTAAGIPLGEEFNLHQIGLFKSFTAELEKRGVKLKVHSASSLFTAIYPQCHDDYVRVAALLLGLEEPSERGVVCRQSTEMKTVIYQIKEVELGTSVGYGPTYYTRRKTRIAVVPVGYADGINRSVQDKASFMLRGKRAKIIGKMCMDYTMIDVTDIPEAREGDEVTVFGRDGGNHTEAYELAGLWGGTVGELTSLITARVPRFYKRSGL